MQYSRHTLSRSVKHMQAAGYQKKNIQSACLAVLLALLAVLAQGSGREPARKVEELSEELRAVTIWAWDENYNVIAAQEAVKVYKERHPDAVFEIVSMAQEEIVARINSAILTGSHKSLPDIALIEDYRIQYFLQNYESEFLPLNGIVYQSDFAPCKTGVNYVGNRVYGVPFDSGTVGLFYRLDLIEQAGYHVEDMQELTWEEFIEIGKRVKEKTGKALLSMDPSDLPLLRMMLQSAGAWYTDENGKLYLEGNEALIQAIEIYREMVLSGITLMAPDWNQFIHGFWEEKVACVLSGSWISASIIEQESQSGLWRVAAVPRMNKNKDSVNASSVGGSGWYVFRYAGRAQEARQFLAETFAADKELLDHLADKINLVSTLKAAQDSENYKKGQPFYGGQMIYQDFIQWTYEIPQVNYGTDTYGVEDFVAGALQEILAGADLEKVLSAYQREYE